MEPRHRVAGIARFWQTARPTPLQENTGRFFEHWFAATLKLFETLAQKVRARPFVGHHQARLGAVKAFRLIGLPLARFPQALVMKTNRRRLKDQAIAKLAYSEREIDVIAIKEKRVRVERSCFAAAVAIAAVVIWRT